ncbi:MAG: hypothetical protein CGU29_05585 [Candidatus Dactylopiibacterium carminicum]|uniref:Flagellar hook-associated protein 2 n=1 Tax=Candidatus Dactylopiibacterium carminicum TaxID=857335 RepID=A0A272EWS5_9RHOO|nr:flagellar filament capping protein FliD [Candidatus Dactylopiibacterium carminicum]KAF7598167.1 hypothetical protein BGI27_14685 [Candidatus Dactylopiibacterium carminicum]PAS94110.1 MAG: hypothetical protein CGU29_05585 [Candidatus Dactylopiibacterium carminicum]PAS96853.1 MAG: hypothetical protein BSR46_14725 [Candidatus Dactylopiibacterium carminicum]
MAGITSSVGLASGIDIEDTITKLMAIEKRPVTLLESKKEVITTKLSSMGLIKSALSEFQAAAAAIDSRTEFAAYSASLADSSIASASASSAAKAGSYSLEVQQLASQQKLVSQSQSSSFKFADGTLKLYGTDGKAISIEVSAAKGNNTLAGVRDAINASGASVNASLLNDGTGTRLVITSKETGTANAVAVRGLGLDYGTVNGEAASTTDSIIDSSATSAAKDALFKLDGVSITRSTNTVADLLSGVTLNLTKTNTDSPTTLTIKTDTDSITTKVKAFVDAYNNLQSVIGTETAYDPTTKAAGALNGDATVRTIQSLRSIVTGMVSGDGAQFLSQAGITMQKDGTLSMDTSKFQEALKDPDIDVARLFVKDSNATGIASAINTRVTGMLSTTGMFTSRTTGLTDSSNDIDDRIDALNTRMDAVEARYRAQFTTLESTLASLNTTSTYLTQQIEALSSFYKSK